MSKREQGRVLAMQALYQWDLRGKDFDDQASDFLSESTQDPEVYFFARELTLGAWSFRKKADVWIRQAATHWEVERMAAVDRNILRLAIYEMLGREDIPPRVAIDQAIELAKRFGAAESGAFVNGILDHVLREAKPELAGRGQSANTGRPEASGPAAAAAPARPAPKGGAAMAARKYPDIKDWDAE
jgi:N utilization substance protein B